MKVSCEFIRSYYQSVVGDLQNDGWDFRASCPFHMDNKESFYIDKHDGDYRCRCGYGSMQQFEMRRAGEAETPRGWTAADRRIIKIANEAMAKSDV